MAHMISFQTSFVHMDTPLPYSSYACNVGLLAIVAIPAHHVEGAYHGRGFNWEQRHWLAYIGVNDVVIHRRREKWRGAWAKLLASWSCFGRGLHVPGPVDAVFRAVTFSTYLLGAWLLRKSFHALSGRDEALSLRLVSLVDMYFAVARCGAP